MNRSPGRNRCVLFLFSGMIISDASIFNVIIGTCFSLLFTVFQIENKVELMETSHPSRPFPALRPARNRAYETTYQREFSAVKQAVPIDEGVPAGERFLIGSPYELTDPVGVSSYAVDFAHQKNASRASAIRPNTARAHRPHPHPQFTHWPRRPDTAYPVVSEETKRALANQLNSTYRTDFIGTHLCRWIICTVSVLVLGSPQGFPLPLAYNRSRIFWNNRAQYTLDSEYRRSYENSVRAMNTPTGRYGFTRRTPANAIVPLTLPVWKQGSSQSTYVREISEKAPSQLYMRDFVDSLHGPMNQ